MIPYGRQNISQDDIDAVTKVLRSDFLTQGPAVPDFETALADKVGAKHVVAVNSATSALHIAALALGLGPGDCLWTVPNTFVASANCGRYCGADVDFVDIDPITWNMSISALRTKLIQANVDGKLPKVVVPVHFSGQPTEQESIWELAQEYGFKIIEDASHAIGASRNGEAVGNCHWSEITIFSFHPVKIVTSGEGGVATTNDPALAAKMMRLRNHGITRDAGLFVTDGDAGANNSDGESPAPWYYEQLELGFNYRITDIQAALGANQIRRLDDFVARRNVLAARYDAALGNLPLQLPTIQAGNKSAFHIYVIRLRLDAITKGHRQVFEELRRGGIGVNLHYIPVHLQPYYRALGFGETQFPEAEAYGRSAITIPLYPSMTDEQQHEVVNILHQVLRDG